MYKFYLDGVMLPVAPSNFTMKIDDKDEEVDLMNGGTLSILNKPGLTEFEFEFMLPGTQLPFAQYDNGFRDPQYYLNKLERLKTNQKAFRFMIVRSDVRNQSVINQFEDTNMLVSLVEYDVTEDAEKGFAYWVNITLKQYIGYTTKRDTNINFEKNEITITDTVERIHETYNVLSEQAYVVQEGDTLVSISQKYFGDPDHAEAIYEFNKNVLGEFTLDPLTAGIVLNMDTEQIEALMKELDEEKAEEQKKQKNELNVYFGLATPFVKLGNLIGGLFE